MTPNLRDRIVAFGDVASPGLLEDAALALLEVANGVGHSTTGEGIYLASIAAELRSLAWERTTGVAK